ncbi:FAD:protein FMN transferase [[Eubacterium] tenue]|nr:FAD:protein FMN transferase [[Eubacterium] tenue]MBC8631233.1 FAD:protein FMN transferase [[Eubacterium] tenue]
MKSKKLTFYITIFIISIISIFFIFNKKVNKFSKTMYYLGTVNEITIYTNSNEEKSNKILSKCEEIIKDIDNKMNPSTLSSDIYKINQNAGKKFTKVSNDTYKVIKTSIHFSDISDGNFDTTIGSLVNLWNIGNQNAKVPMKSEIDKALSTINYKNITLDDKDNQIMLKNKDSKIDLGGIAKGYAADKVVEYLKNQEVKGAIVNLGGNIYTLGTKDKDANFNIGIQDPTKPRGNSIGSLSISNKSVVTSGIYERYIKKDNKIYHHILSPKTGFPVDNELSSVTIISDNSMNCDALSTTTFSLGTKEGLKLIESLPNTQAIFITKDKDIYLSSGLKDSFKLTDSTFTIKN